MPHHKQKDQPQPSIICYFVWANEKEPNPPVFEIAMERYQETLLEIVPLLPCSWFSFLRSFAHVLPYSTCLQGMSLWADLPCEGPTTSSVDFSLISLFPHEICRKWIPIPSFFCVFLEQKRARKMKLLSLLSWLKRTSWLVSLFFALQSLVLNSPVEV